MVPGKHLEQPSPSFPRRSPVSQGILASTRKLPGDAWAPPEATGSLGEKEMQAQLFGNVQLGSRGDADK